MSAPKERQRKSAAELRRSGGRRVTVNLKAIAARALEQLAAKTATGTTKEAIEQALLESWWRLQRR